MFSRVVACFCILGLAGCGMIEIEPGFRPYEKVTSITLTPSRPQVDQDVMVEIDYASNMAYPGIEGGGPRFTYAVTGGELIGQVYDDETNDWREVRGQQITTSRLRATWHTPMSPGVYKLSAVGISGGPHLDVEVAPE